MKLVKVTLLALSAIGAVTLTSCGSSPDPAPAPVPADPSYVAPAK